MGEPETERTFTDGSKRLEYPRGPAGTNTYMVDPDADGRFVSVTQVLTAQNFAKVRPGMTMDETQAARQADHHRRISVEEGARLELALARGRRHSGRNVQRALRSGQHGRDDFALRVDPRRATLS